MLDDRHFCGDGIAILSFHWTLSQPACHALSDTCYFIQHLMGLHHMSKKNIKMC